MSIQSDVEMLSLQAVENYARRNNISTKDTYELFHKHQVFEKIMLQHEYLHQVSGCSPVNSFPWNYENV